MAKIKEPGRPEGSPNKKSMYVRDEYLNCRVTQGFNKTIEALMATDAYKSKADVIHEALMHLAHRKLTDKTHLYWVNRIM